MVELLLKKNARRDIKDKKGKTALDIAKEKGRSDIVKLFDFEAEAFFGDIKDEGSQS